jgi:hypothetical protein
MQSSSLAVATAWRHLLFPLPKHETTRVMAAMLQNTRLVNKKGEAVSLDPSLPVYLYFGAEW